MAIALLLGGYLVTGWAASIIRYFQLVRLSGLAMRSVRRLRESVYGHVMRLPMAFFDRAITGQLVSRVTNDTESIKQLYTQVLFEVLVGLTVLFGVVVAMLWLDWRLMLIVLLLVPATAVIVWGYQRLSADAVTRSRELRSDINAQMAEGIAGMNVLQATGAVERFARRFADTNERTTRRGMGEVRANAWLLRPALDFLNILLIVGIVAAVGTQHIDGIEVGSALCVHRLRGARGRAADPDHAAVLDAAAIDRRGVAGERAAARRARRRASGTIAAWPRATSRSPT